MLVGIADHHANTGQRRQLSGRALCVAACHQNPCRRILTMDAANGGARVLVCRCGHGAGIQDYNFGRVGIARAFQAAIEQLALNRGAIGLRRATAEILHVIRRHQLIILTVTAGALRAKSKQVYDHIQRMANRAIENLLGNHRREGCILTPAVSGSAWSGVSHETSHSAS